MANYDPTRATRLYCDEVPKWVASRVAQGYKVEGVDHVVWRTGSIKGWWRTFEGDSEPGGRQVKRGEKVLGS